MATLTAMLGNGRVNAALSWISVLFLLVAAVESVLDGEVLWAGLALTTAAVALVPAVLARGWTVLPPWEVLLLATLPLLGRSLGLLTQVATYLSVAALALLIAVELDAFTSVEMTSRFAVLFVVVTTMAVAGLWAVAQFGSDAYLGTSFLRDANELMWDLVVATAVGLGAGVLFEGYFRRYGPDRPQSRHVSAGGSR